MYNLYGFFANQFDKKEINNLMFYLGNDHMYINSILFWGPMDMHVLLLYCIIISLSFTCVMYNLDER